MATTEDHSYISSTYYKEEDPAVQTVADHVVSCADPTRLPTAPYKVGPIGQLIASQIPIQVVFVYPSTAVVTAAQLQKALALVLDDYPHLTGRLMIDPHGIMTMERFGTGAQLREARCSHTLASLAGSHRKSCADASSASFLSLMDLPCGSNALFPPLPITPETVSEAPPLVVQLTHFACGGVALGLRLLHVLCDGTGFFQFAQDLVGRCNGTVAGGAPPPCLTPYLSDFVSTATPEALTAARAYEPPLLQLMPPPPPGPQPIPPPPPEIHGRELYFTAAQLADIKRQCTDQSGSGWVSTFEALGAFLATHIYQVRHQRLYMPGAHYYLSPVDIRTRVLPSAAEAARYFPMGSISACGPLPEDALRDGALPVVAAAVHAMIRSEHLSTPALHHQLRWVAAQEEPTRIRSNFQYGGFMLSAWNKFDMYGAMRLGGVAPVFVGTPFTRISLLDGLAYVLPHPRPLTSSTCTSAAGDKKTVEEDGSLMVVVALNALLWEALSSDEHLGPFMKHQYKHKL